MVEYEEEEGAFTDEFMKDYIVSKKLDFKVMDHPDFETVCSKFWQLLKNLPGCNRTCDTIGFEQYRDLMQRVQKVLLPLYRAEEMEKEIAQEWIMDARGQSKMDLNLFQKLLFRIAHYWATHVDIPEYCEILEKIYDRITCRKIIRGETGEAEVVLPRIAVDMYQDQDLDEDEGYLTVEEDEEQMSDYTYRDIEDEEGKTKKQKKRRPDEDEGDVGGLLMTVREPFKFMETVQYYKNDGEEESEGAAVHPPSEQDVEVDILSEMTDVYPLGYPTEQFICKLKNDIRDAFTKLKEDRRKALAEMRRQMFENAAAQKMERPPEVQKDPGLLEAKGFLHVEPFKLHDTVNKVRVRTVATIKDHVYNQLRQIFKDSTYFVIRPHFDNPTKAVLKNKQQQASEFKTQVSPFGYNPALERRLEYFELNCEMADGNFSKFVNVNYLLADPVFVTAHRSDVNRIETGAKMSVRPSEEQPRDEEFPIVTTSYKKTMEIMLVKKFESFFTAKMTTEDPTEKARADKIFKEYSDAKATATTVTSLAGGWLSESYDEANNLLKITRGPFYKYISKEGIREDNFVTCAQNDLIESVNQDVMRILIIGKPRVGKTTLAKALEKELDLVRIAPELWIEDMFKRFADRAENPPDPIPMEPDVEAEEAYKVEYAKRLEEKKGKIKEEKGEDYNSEDHKDLDLEDDEKPDPGPPFEKEVEWRTPLELAIQQQLMEGKSVTTEQINQIMTLQIQDPKAQTKGFVLDLSFSKASGSLWMQRFQDSGMLDDNEITHVVDMEMDDEEVRLRAENLRSTPHNGLVYSRWERNEFKKKKPVKLDENGEPIEDEETEYEDGVVPPPKIGRPLDETKLVSREQDSNANILGELNHYTNDIGERTAFNRIIQKMHDSTFVKIQVAGLTPDEVSRAVVYRLKPNVSAPLRPIAIPFEDGAGDFKALLTEGLNPDDLEDDKTLARQWSLWKTTDPVALTEGKVEPGVPDNAAHFANNVFVFANEENKNSFVKDPRFYLKEAPSMPENYRMMVLGPRGSGVKTQSKMLEAKYGWKVVDFNAIVQDKLREIIQMPTKLPNNICTDLGPCMVSMNEEELETIKKGEKFDSWKFLPWILEYLDIPLRVQLKPEEEEKEQDPGSMTPRTQQAHQKKQKAKLAAQKAAAQAEADRQARKAARRAKREAARAAGEDTEEFQSTEEETKIDDLSIEEIVLGNDESGKPLKVPGFILIGFPQTEVHIQKLYEYGFGFDKVLFLNDTNEEDPGKEIKERMSLLEDTAYDFDDELAQAKKILDTVKEGKIKLPGEKDENGEMQEGEEVNFVEETAVIEIDCTGNEEKVFTKIQTALDPFFLQADNPDDVRVTADLDLDPEEGKDKPLPKSDFGDYCPVTYVDSGFMVKGNPELESTLFGKTYLFAGEKEQETFKFDPSKYLLAMNGKATLPLAPPPPKIMIMGLKGSGVTTQIRMLCDKFKLEEFELLNEYLKRQKIELEKRQRARYLERGYKGVPKEDDPEEQEEPTEEEKQKAEENKGKWWLFPPDDEVINDPDDFDKENHEKELMQMILESSRGLIIDGNWSTCPEELVTAPLQDLLVDSRRMPEVVVTLKCKEENSLKRVIDMDAIEAKYKEDEEKYQEGIKKKRDKEFKEYEDGLDKEIEDEEDAEAKKTLVDEKQGKIDQWNEDRDQADADEMENDPERPNLEERQTKAKEDVQEQLTKDQEHLEGFVEALKEKKVKVIENLDTDVSAEYIHIKLLEKLKEHIQFRPDLIEREQAQPLKENEVIFFEKSYTVKHSKFGLSSPITPYNPIKTKKFTVLYRERLYFLSDAEEQKQFLLEPSKYIKEEAFPTDISIKPRIIVFGLPKSGKTTLCQSIAQKTGAIHLQMDEVIEDFMTRDSSFADDMREHTKVRGRKFDETDLIKLFAKRVEQFDCQANGWIVEGFPMTRPQSELLLKRSLHPNNVFFINIPTEEVYKRSEPLKQEEFGCDRTILATRLRYLNETLPQTIYFFHRRYNNVTCIDGMRSSWFIQDVALSAIQSNLQSRMNFARDYHHGGSDKRPCIMQNMNIDRCYFKKALSQFGHYCPVSWKNEKKFINACQRPEHCVLYKNLFYYFNTIKDRDIFVKAPKRFTEKIIFSSARNVPLRLRLNKAAEVMAQEKELLAYCPVTLKEEDKKLEKGNQLLCVQYKEAKFIFHTEEKLQRFMLNPSKFVNDANQLPVKIPPAKDPVTLNALQKEENSITYLEQALGSVVTKGLREIGETRLKYPTLSIKETMLKLFAIFLKAENPANTPYMKEKYMKKMTEFLEKCTVPEELHQLAEEKAKDKPKGKWPQFKEDYYNQLGEKYDRILKEVEKEKADGFAYYLK